MKTQASRGTDRWDSIHDPIPAPASNTNHLPSVSRTIPPGVTDIVIGAAGAFGGGSGAVSPSMDRSVMASAAIENGFVR